MKNQRKEAFLGLWMFAALSGCNLYYDLADPSVEVPASDRPIDRTDAVPDQPILDGPDVPPIDGQPFPPDVPPDALPDVVPDLFPMEDRFLDILPDEVLMVDLPDGSDRADASDADDVPSEPVDVMDGDVAEDVLDVPPDRSDEDVADVSSEDASLPDALDDVPDAMGDVPMEVDAPETPEAGDVPDATPDLPPPPELVITYATMRGPVVLPPDQDASRIDYSFGGGTRTACSASRLDPPLWRCTVPTVPPAARMARALYFTIPGACGIGTGRSCDGWPTLWSITWLGVAYDADTFISTDAGREPALRLADRTECTAQMDYTNICVRLNVQP